MSERPPVQPNPPEREPARKPEAEAPAHPTPDAVPALESAPTQELIDKNKKKLEEVVARLNANKPESVSAVESESDPKNEGNIESHESREGEPGNKDKHNKEKIKGKDGQGKEKHQDPHEKEHGKGGHGKERDWKFKLNSAGYLGGATGLGVAFLWGEAPTIMNALHLSSAVQSGITGIGLPATGLANFLWTGPLSFVALSFLGNLVGNLVSEWKKGNSPIKDLAGRLGIPGGGGGEGGGGTKAAKAPAAH